MTTPPEPPVAPVLVNPIFDALDALVLAARNRQIEADLAGDSLMVVAFGKAYDRLLDRRLSMAERNALERLLDE